MSKKALLGARVTENILKALDEAKWILRMPKGKIVEEAIKEYLQKHCPQVYEEYLSEKDRKRD